MSGYQKYFPKIGIPYLGTPYREQASGPLSIVKDLAELPDDTKIIEIWPKTKNVDQLHRFKKCTTVCGKVTTPECIDQLEQLPNLRYLELSLNGVTSVPSLEGLKNLRVLVAKRGTKVDWKFLKGVTWLHSLCIGGTPTQLPLKHVGNISELRELFIDSGAMITSLNPLKKLTELQFLMLFNKVTLNKPSIRPLASLKKLNNLQLSPRYEVQDFDYLLERLPAVKSIKLNAGLSWPPTNVPAEQAQAKGKVKPRVKVEGNKLSLEHDM